MKQREKLNKIGVEAICEYVCDGYSLLSWAERNKFAYNTVLDWINADEERAASYARARQTREDRKFEQIDEIGTQAANAESAVQVQGLRLQADNLKWTLSRMNPRKYGDKVDVEHTGGVVISVSNIDEKI